MVTDRVLLIYASDDKGNLYIYKIQKVWGQVSIMKKTDIQLLHTKAAAEMIGICTGTLRTWRSQGKGPKYYKCIGKKGAVRYAASDLIEWINKLRQNSPKL